MPTAYEVLRPTFVLGANDPEMQEISQHIEGTGLDVWYAAVNGERCHPGNAYVANSIVCANLGTVKQLGNNYDNFVFVECRPWDVPCEQKYQRLTALDHHEEGDTAYSLPPHHYWQASSLGQVIGLLAQLGHSIAITQEMRVLAAMDHCRQAAIRGECPGVSADEVIARRIASIAKTHSVSAKAVRQGIGEFQELLEKRPRQRFADGEVVDFTDIHLGTGYSLGLLIAQTALDITGAVGLLRNNEAKAKDTEKIAISGHATPQMVQYFMEVYASHRKLVRVYGVPQRGYAGGYLP